MNKLQKLSVALVSVTAISMAMPSFADTAPSASQCSTYLTGDDDSFVSTINKSTSQAATVASLLDACMNYNVCSDIDDLDNCVATLSTRDYLSHYHADYTPRTPVFSLPLLLSSAPSVTKNSVRNTSKGPASPAKSTSGPDAKSNTKSNTSSSINWF
jgi:hypothetical protein